MAMAFKSVHWQGFDAAADVARDLERRVDTVADEIGTMAGDVDVTFDLKGTRSKPILRVNLSIARDEMSAESAAIAPLADVQSDRDFRQWVRRAWGQVLDQLLDQILIRVRQNRVAAAGV